jgi:hypothetical protein
MKLKKAVEKLAPEGKLTYDIKHNNNNMLFKNKYTQNTPNTDAES